MNAGWNLGHGGGGYDTAVNGSATFTTDGGTVGNGPIIPNTPHNNMPPFYVLAYIIKL